MKGLDIVLAVGGISVLVILHELGHYLVARASGMTVTRFSVGFGPALFRYQPKNSPTVFQVCLIPFLAYVAIAGMNPAEQVDPEDPRNFNNKSLFARVATIAGGPLANYITASLLVFGIGVTGWPEEVPTQPLTVAQVSADSPSARAGVQVGDVVEQADGRPVRTIEELIEVTAPRAGKPTVYVVRRGEQRFEWTITPQDRGGRGIIGVVPKTARRYVPMPVPKALMASVTLPFQLTVAQLTELGKRIHQGSMEGVAGPVGMGKIVAQQASKGPVEYLSILMLLSVALGMFNLLPFPALDGGRLVFLAYEAITHRKPNERFEAIVHTVGLVMLLSFLVLVTFREVS
jgi:regulator of sigma E protease